MADRIGTEIAGYRIESLISRGGMGEVYLAEQDSPKRKVALKLLSPELSEDAGFRERFSRESEAAASIDHPNVIPIYASGRSDGALFIAMRYVEGTDLRTLLAREGPLPAERAVRICAQIADALEAAHERGLVHRDVKPANILVGRADHAYLSDFGLIRRSEVSTAITKTGQFMGTIDYVAPEQIKGQAVDGWADVYSLGCVLYECLTGEPPFRRETEVATLYAHLEDPPPVPSATFPMTPPAMDQVVARAMAKRPDERFASAQEFGTALRASVEPEVVSKAGPSPEQRRRRRWLAMAVVGAAVVVVVAVLALVTNPGTGGPQGPAAAMAPPLNSVVNVNPESGKVVATVPHVGTGVIGVGDRRPRVLFGEGSVWLLQATTIYQLDPETSELSGRIEVGDSPPKGTFAVGSRTVWVGSGVNGGGSQGLIQRFNPSTLEPLKAIRTGDETAYAVIVGEHDVWAGLQNGELLQINGPTGAIEDRFPSGVGSIDALAVSGNQVWVGDKLDGIIARVDPVSHEHERFSISGNIDSMVADDSGVWILNEFSRTVTPVDPDSGKVGEPIPVGEDPSDLAIGLGSVWVTDQTEGVIYRIDPDLPAVVDELQLGAPLASVAVDALNRDLWVSVSEVGQA